MTGWSDDRDDPRIYPSVGREKNPGMDLTDVYKTTVPHR